VVGLVGHLKDLAQLLKLTTDAVKIPASRPPPTTVEPEKSKKSTASKPSTSKEFKVLSRSQYYALSTTEKRAYNDERDRIAASKASEAASKAAESLKTAAKSTKSKVVSEKSKSAASQKPDGDPVKATSDAPDVDITVRSSKIARTPNRCQNSCVFTLI